MPHGGQILPPVARPLTAGLLLFAASACDRTGKVVVVLDTTMRREGVEVVAFRGADDTRSESSSGPKAVSASRGRRATTPVEDSAAMLASRFRILRDSLNAEVARLDSLDRRTRAYAVRYAEIRRRTLAAEALRARRDSMYARAEALRGNSDAATRTGSGAGSGSKSLLSFEDAPGLQRHTVKDSTVVLELAPGRWSIGAARAGELLAEATMLTIVSGKSDTLRISGAGGRRGDNP